MALTVTQKKKISLLVDSVVALEKAEVVFDSSSKAIIDLYHELLADKDIKGTLKEKNSLVFSLMMNELGKHEAKLSDHVYKRVVDVCKTVHKYISLGVILKVNLIPFTLISKVTKLLDKKAITKKQIANAHKKEDTKYKEALENLCIAGDYKLLVGSVDYSMLDDETVTLVKALDEASLKGLQGLVKVQLGA